MSYLSDWKNIKKRYESATGKSKPGETFLGLFRKSSGLEKATESVDKAIDKKDAKALGKAVVELQKTATQYITSLLSASPDALMEKELKRMQKALVDLVAEANGEKLDGGAAGLDAAGMKARIGSEKAGIIARMDKIKSELRRMRKEYDSVAEMIKSVATGKGSKQQIETLKKTIENRIKMVGVMQDQCKAEQEKAKKTHARTNAAWKANKELYLAAGLEREWDKYDEYMFQIVEEIRTIDEFVAMMNDLKNTLATASAKRLDHIDLLKKQLTVFYDNVRAVRHRFYKDGSELAANLGALNDMLGENTPANPAGAMAQADQYLLKATKALDSLVGHDLYKRKDAYIKILKAYDNESASADDMMAVDSYLEEIRTARGDVERKLGRLRQTLAAQRR
jgi:vacuolar-type H+-ATPase subunit I/STV1